MSEFIAQDRCGCNQISFTVSEAQDIADALHVAMDDIRELLQVAKYNLRGQINTGEIVEKPNPPMLVHEAGISKSEAVMERCRKVWRAVWEKIQTEDSNATNMERASNK